MCAGSFSISWHMFALSGPWSGAGGNGGGGGCGEGGCGDGTNGGGGACGSGGDGAGAGGVKGKGDGGGIGGSSGDGDGGSIGGEGGSCGGGADGGWLQLAQRIPRLSAAAADQSRAAGFCCGWPSEETTLEVSAPLSAPREAVDEAAGEVGITTATMMNTAPSAVLNIAMATTTTCRSTGHHPGDGGGDGVVSSLASIRECLFCLAPFLSLRPSGRADDATLPANSSSLSA